MVTGLRTWWVAAVTTPFLQLYITPLSLVIGYVSGVLASLATIAWTLHKRDASLSADCSPTRWMTLAVWSATTHLELDDCRRFADPRGDLGSGRFWSQRRGPGRHGLRRDGWSGADRIAGFAASTTRRRPHRSVGDDGRLADRAVGAAQWRWSSGAQRADDGPGRVGEFSDRGDQRLPSRSAGDTSQQNKWHRRLHARRRKRSTDLSGHEFRRRGEPSSASPMPTSRNWPGRKSSPCGFRTATTPAASISFNHNNPECWARASC